MKWKIIIATIICLGSIFLFIIAPRIGINMENILPQVMKGKVLSAGELVSNVLLNNTKDSLKTELNSSQFIISKWNESKFIGYLPLTTSTSTSKVGTIDKVTLTNSVYSSDFYMKDENNFEWEIVLDSRPLTNSFSIPIKLENIECYYQYPLNETPKEIDSRITKNCNNTYCEYLNEKGELDEVANMPDNIVGSYSCYGNKQNKEYETGKVLQIYRPLAIDSLGNNQWCNLEITKDILNVTCPNTFLSNARYPVKIDPAFGNQNIGGTGRDTGNQRCQMYNVTEEATVFQINGYAGAASTIVQYSMAIYNSTSETLVPPKNKSINTAEYDINTVDGWRSYTVTNTIIPINATRGYSSYFICQQAGNATYGGQLYTYYTDTVAGTITAGHVYMSGWQDPFGSNSFTTAYRMSLYANYTTGAPPSNCWTYDAGTKLLTIPDGCLYNNSQYGI